MKKEQKILLIVSILCALAVLLVGIFMIMNPPQENPAPTGTQPETTHFNGESCEKDETTAPTQGTEATEPDTKEEQVTPPPTNLPPTVEITPEKDPDTGKPEKLTFPCTVPGYALSLEKLAPYDGMFVEDGSNADVQQVAMMMVKNNGDYPVEYTQICVEYGEEKLYFDISALPKGETVVVQEKSCKKVPNADVTKATALVVQRAELEMSEKQIRVTDNGDNTLTVENLTDETIPTTRVFYKYYMQEEGLFVGGIAFTVRISRLAPKGKMTVQPAHYNSTTGRVVMVQTYGE